MSGFIKKLMLVLWFSVATLSADEGMFMLDQIRDLNLPKSGLKIKPKQLWNKKDGGLVKAVVSLGGCTAAFVSPNGLIATNYHCAFGSIQKNSSPENNLMEKGFLARTLQDELPTHGTNVSVLQDFKNVTDQVLAGVDDKMDDKTRVEVIKKNRKRIQDEAEKSELESARVADFNNGTAYYLFKFLQIRDVRLVYAPPGSIGKFGGDIDNFEWPRHTGDYTFLRAYVGPDGKPAKPSEKNIPYKPEKWLQVTPNGLSEDDFVMVFGFPGNTQRYRTSFEIQYLQESYYPQRIEMFRDWIAILEAESAQDPAVEVKLASRLNGLNNSLKNSLGQLDGLKRLNVSARKQVFEKELTESLAQNPKWQQKYGAILPVLEKLNRENQAFAQRNTIRRYLYQNCQPLAAASRVDRWRQERLKPESEREEGYRDKDIEQENTRLQNAIRSYDMKADKRLFTYMLKRAIKLPADQKILAIEKIITGKEENAEAAIDQYVDEVYRSSLFTDLTRAAQVFAWPDSELTGLTDPFLQLAADLQQEFDRSKDTEEANKGALDWHRKKYLEAIRKIQSKVFYYDANGTLRLTFGKVKGYSPRTSVEYRHYTTLDGILEKHTDQEPFDCPDELMQMARNGHFGPFMDTKTDKLWVNFLTDLDTTGGNSGSPVLNASGQLVGLLFDGNYESIVSDYYFDAPMTRSICVDIRYVLWLMDNLHQAQHLLQEMGIK